MPVLRTHTWQNTESVFVIKSSVRGRQRHSRLAQNEMFRHIPKGLSFLTLPSWGLPLPEQK